MVMLHIVSNLPREYHDVTSVGTCMPMMRFNSQKIAPESSM